MRNLVLGFVLVIASSPAIADERGAIADELGWVITIDRQGSGVSCAGRCWNDRMIKTWTCTTKFPPTICAINCGKRGGNEPVIIYGCASNLSQGAVDREN
jgi:hypothetical protein